MSLEQFTQKKFDEKFKEVYDELTKNKTSVHFPKGILLGGQPGSGKTTIHFVVRENNPNIIVINGDDFRSYHPNFSKLQKKYGNDAVKYTQKFSNQMVECLIDKLSSKKYNLLIEGTLRTTGTPLNTYNLLKSKGYSVELSVMAVSKEVSWQGTINRFNEMQSMGLTPRATPKESHDVVVNNIVQNLDELYKLNKFDNITLYNRNQECLYSMQDTPNVNPAPILSNIVHGKNILEEKKSNTLSWDSFNQADETHNENVVKNPYKVEGCTPVSQKVDRSTPNEVKHDNSISKDIEKPKKTTKL